MKRSSVGDKEILVLDTAGLLIATSISSPQEIYTVPRAIDEVRDETSRSRLELVLSSGKIRITQPSKDSIREIEEIVNRQGFREALSQTDIEVLALALDLVKRGSRVVVVSDDSFIHRVARSLGIRTMSIKHRVSGTSSLRYYVCPVCGYRSLKRFDRCPVCGTVIRSR